MNYCMHTILSGQGGQDGFFFFLKGICTPLGPPLVAPLVTQLVSVLLVLPLMKLKSKQNRLIPRRDKSLESFDFQSDNANLIAAASLTETSRHASYCPEMLISSIHCFTHSLSQTEQRSHARFDPQA